VRSQTGDKSWRGQAFRARGCHSVLNANVEQVAASLSFKQQDKISYESTACSAGHWRAGWGPEGAREEG
jgi:hypothetical protein